MKSSLTIVYRAMSKNDKDKDSDEWVEKVSSTISCMDIEEEDKQKAIALFLSYVYYDIF